MSKQANLWAQRNLRAKQAVGSKQRSKWPSALPGNFIVILPIVQCRDKWMELRGKGNLSKINFKLKFTHVQSPLSLAILDKNRDKINSPKVWRKAPCKTFFEKKRKFAKNLSKIGTWNVAELKILDHFKEYNEHNIDFSLNLILMWLQCASATMRCNDSIVYDR